MKSFILLITLLVVVFVAPQANAQALLGFRINGTVYCSPGGAPLVNSTPPFANATVQVMIGPIPIGAAVKTNTKGEFVIDLRPSMIGSLANKLQSLDAKVVVTTPLTACNSSLPANTFLQSVPPFRLLSGVNNTTGRLLADVLSYVCVTIFGGL